MQLEKASSPLSVGAVAAVVLAAVVAEPTIATRGEALPPHPAASSENAAAAATEARMRGRKRMLFPFLSVGSGENHGDSEAAAQMSPGRDGGVVRVSYRLHDGETEPDTVTQ